MRKLIFSAPFLFLISFVIPTHGTAYYQPRPDGEYDNHNYLVDPSRISLERLAESVVQLKTEFTLELEDGTQISRISTSSGVVVKSGIITIAHAVSTEEFFIQGPFGSIPLPVKKIVDVKTSFDWGGNEHILDLLYVNKDDDVVFLGLPVGVNFPPFPISVGNSDDLKIGNFIYVIGNPFAIYEDNTRSGIVSALQTPEELEGDEVKRENVFMITNGLIPGDSGSLVMAIRDGHYEFVGIGQGVSVANSSLGWAIRINIIRDLIANKCDKCSRETRDFFTMEGDDAPESQ